MPAPFEGFHYPVAVDAGLGRLRKETDYPAYVVQLIKQVLLTAPGERVNVTVSVTHNWIGDLSLALVGPSGVRVPLVNNPGGPNNDGNNLFNTTFDDSAATSINGGSAPYTGSFRPVGSLEAFNHTSPNGVWKLEASDAASPERKMNRFMRTFLSGPRTAPRCCRSRG